MNNLQTSTIRVPKTTLENIKRYCRKNAQPIGEFVEKAWTFIEKNDFDIYDNEATPAIPVPAEREKEEINQVEILVKLMSEFIVSQKQLQLPITEFVSSSVHERQHLEEQLKQRNQEIISMRKVVQALKKENEDLKKWKEKAYIELTRIEREQRFFGKVEIKKQFE